MTSETVTLHHQDIGSGSPVVILHGLFGSGANWRAVGRGLADRHRVILVDLRNHGASPHAQSMAYPAQAADVIDLLDRLGLDQPVIVGHSMGGKVAMVLALTEPQRVGRLVVVDIAPVDYPASHADLIRAMRELDTSSIARRSEADHALAESIPDAAVRQFLLQNLVARDGRYHWRLNLEVLEREREAIYGFPKLFGHTFGGRALFVAGERSGYVRTDTHARIRALFPAARIETVAGAGHWVHAEKPDAVQQLIEAFIAE